jgi:Rrf2 family iron-sulfur cluster assembly transcriptional regulator
LSAASQYALKALAYIAVHGDGPVYSQEIADATGIPANYLSKVLHLLVKRGLIRSVRGRGGGFWLSASPGDITLYDVVSVFEDIDFPRDCLLGQHFCSDAAPCAAHAAWKPISDQIVNFFKTRTLADLIRKEEAAETLAGPAQGERAI